MIPRINKCVNLLFKAPVSQKQLLTGGSDKSTLSLITKIAQPLPSTTDYTDSSKFFIGLCNALGVFHRPMDVMNSSAKKQVMFFLSQQYHNLLQDTDTASLKRLQFFIPSNCAGVALKLRKTRFFTNIFRYPSQVIRPGQVKLASHTANSIYKVRLPTTTAKRKSFFELYRSIW